MDRSYLSDLQMSLLWRTPPEATVLGIPDVVEAPADLVKADAGTGGKRGNSGVATGSANKTPSTAGPKEPGAGGSKAPSTKGPSAPATKESAVGASGGQHAATGREMPGHRWLSREMKGSKASGAPKYQYKYTLATGLGRGAKADQEINLGYGKNKQGEQDPGDVLKVTASDDKGVTFEHQGKSQTVSHDQWHEKMHEAFGDDYTYGVDQHVRRWANAVYKHVPKESFDEINKKFGDNATADQIITHLKETVDKVYETKVGADLQKAFGRIGIQDESQVKSMLGFVLARRGWTPDARAGLIGMATGGMEAARIAKSYKSMALRAERLAGGKALVTGQQIRAAVHHANYRNIKNYHEHRESKTLERLHKHNEAALSAGETHTYASDANGIKDFLAHESTLRGIKAQASRKDGDAVAKQNFLAWDKIAESDPAKFEELLKQKNAEFQQGKLNEDGKRSGGTASFQSKFLNAAEPTDKEKKAAAKTTKVKDEHPIEAAIRQHATLANGSDADKQKFRDQYESYARVQGGVAAARPAKGGKAAVSAADSTSLRAGSPMQPSFSPDEFNKQVRSIPPKTVANIQADLQSRPADQLRPRLAAYAKQAQDAGQTWVTVNHLVQALHAAGGVAPAKATPAPPAPPENAPTTTAPTAEPEAVPPAAAPTAAEPPVGAPVAEPEAVPPAAAPTAAEPPVGAPVAEPKAAAPAGEPEAELPAESVTPAAEADVEDTGTPPELPEEPAEDTGEGHETESLVADVHTAVQHGDIPSAVNAAVDASNVAHDHPTPESVADALSAIEPAMEAAKTAGDDEAVKTLQEHQDRLEEVSDQVDSGDPQTNLGHATAALDASVSEGPQAQAAAAHRVEEVLARTAEDHPDIMQTPEVAALRQHVDVIKRASAEETSAATETPEPAATDEPTAEPEAAAPAGEPEAELPAESGTTAEPEAVPPAAAPTAAEPAAMDEPTAEPGILGTMPAKANGKGYGTQVDKLWAKLEADAAARPGETFRELMQRKGVFAQAYALLTTDKKTDKGKSIPGAANLPEEDRTKLVEHLKAALKGRDRPKEVSTETKPKRTPKSKAVEAPAEDVPAEDVTVAEPPAAEAPAPAPVSNPVAAPEKKAPARRGKLNDNALRQNAAEEAAATALAGEAAAPSAKPKQSAIGQIPTSSTGKSYNQDVKQSWDALNAIITADPGKARQDMHTRGTPAYKLFSRLKMDSGNDQTLIGHFLSRMQTGVEGEAPAEGPAPKSAVTRNARQGTVTTPAPVQAPEPEVAVEETPQQAREREAQESTKKTEAAFRRRTNMLTSGEERRLKDMKPDELERLKNLVSLIESPEKGKEPSAAKLKGMKANADAIMYKHGLPEMYGSADGEVTTDGSLEIVHDEDEAVPAPAAPEPDAPAVPAEPRSQYKDRDEAGYDEDGFNAEGFDHDGFNSDGYNRDGFNSEGFDSKGVDEEGFNEDGFDKEGYNRDGFNEDGYNSEGFDEEGYDEDGLDEAGFDEDGFNEEGYDKNGFDGDGYDEDGFDKKGYAEDGLDREGFDKNGLSAEKSDKNGYQLQRKRKSGSTPGGWEVLAPRGDESIGVFKTEKEAAAAAAADYAKVSAAEAPAPAGDDLTTEPAGAVEPPTTPKAPDETSVADQVPSGEAPAVAPEQRGAPDLRQALDAAGDEYRQARERAKSAKDAIGSWKTPEQKEEQEAQLRQANKAERDAAQRMSQADSAWERARKEGAGAPTETLVTPADEETPAAGAARPAWEQQADADVDAMVTRRETARSSFPDSTQPAASRAIREFTQALPAEPTEHKASLLAAIHAVRREGQLQSLTSLNAALTTLEEWVVHGGEAQRRIAITALHKAAGPSALGTDPKAAGAAAQLAGQLAQALRGEAPAPKDTPKAAPDWVDTGLGDRAADMHQRLSAFQEKMQSATTAERARLVMDAPEDLQRERELQSILKDQGEGSRPEDMQTNTHVQAALDTIRRATKEIKKDKTRDPKVRTAILKQLKEKETAFDQRGEQLVQQAVAKMAGDDLTTEAPAPAEAVEPPATPGALAETNAADETLVAPAAAPEEAPTPEVPEAAPEAPKAPELTADTYQDKQYSYSPQFANALTGAHNDPKSTHVAQAVHHAMQTPLTADSPGVATAQAVLQAKPEVLEAFNKAVAAGSDPDLRSDVPTAYREAKYLEGFNKAAQPQARAKTLVNWFDAAGVMAGKAAKKVGQALLAGALMFGAMAGGSAGLSTQSTQAEARQTAAASEAPASGVNAEAPAAPDSARLTPKAPTAEAPKAPRIGGDWQPPARTDWEGDDTKYADPHMQRVWRASHEGTPDDIRAGIDRDRKAGVFTDLKLNPPEGEFPSTGNPGADHAIKMVQKLDKHSHFKLGGTGKKNKNGDTEYQCSSFASDAVGIPRMDTDSMYRDATKGHKHLVQVAYEDMQAGDLILHPDTYEDGVHDEGHVGVVIDPSPDHFVMADSSHSDDGVHLRKMHPDLVTAKKLIIARPIHTRLQKAFELPIVEPEADA